MSNPAKFIGSPVNQMPRRLTAAASLSLLALVAGCGSAGTPGSSSVSQEPTPAETEAASAAASAPSGADFWIMPDLRGMNLQNAQDRIQAVTQDPIFQTTSHDLRGSRHQVVDRNWQVCTQSVAPGARFTAASAPDFGVVRAEVEKCP